MSEPGAPGHIVELVSNARLQALIRYWQGKCRGRPAPSFKDLDPVEIPRLLPIMLIADIAQGHARIHLLGSEATNFCGQEMRGRSIEAFDFGAFTATWIEAFSLAARTARPTAAAGAFCDGVRNCNVETVLLPLSGSGGNIDLILGGLHVKSAVPDGQLARAPKIRVLAAETEPLQQRAVGGQGGSEAPRAGSAADYRLCSTGQARYRVSEQH